MIHKFCTPTAPGISVLVLYPEATMLEATRTIRIYLSYYSISYYHPHLVFLRIHKVT